MNRDHNAPPDLDDDDDLDGESHAADEPTAVWDESALRAAGLTDLLQRRDAEPAPPPATPSVHPHDAAPSIVVDDVEPSLAAPILAAEPAEESALARGLGWGATMLIAVVLGAAVYALIRFVRG